MRYQDMCDDAEIGIKSTARLFGSFQTLGSVVLCISSCLLALPGLGGGFGQGFYALIILAAGFALVQILAWRTKTLPIACSVSGPIAISGLLFLWRSCWVKCKKAGGRCDGVPSPSRGGLGRGEASWVFCFKV